MGSLESQVNAISKENESSKTEVKEVLQALEELAVNYDQKLQEVDLKSKENESFMEELNTKQNELNKCLKDIDQLNETTSIMRRKVAEITNILLEELVRLYNYQIVLVLVFIQVGVILAKIKYLI